MNRTSEYNSALLLSGNNFLDYAGYDYVVRAIDDEGIKWLADGTVADATTVSTPMLQAFRDRAKCRDREGNGSVFPEVPLLR
ncbi:hypothetical protein HPB50_016845 [Hyalomma asiaticum]|uniref:Uncharacterized protein n=1 Tax=Hyalomma asiaticum TaxID=266040 RepID=A0ACB7S197_HYAAI|nr:hypothetical protein HPB50_016845 [Hyalomma asiaticum]